jgi:hypothetical protein
VFDHLAPGTQYNFSVIAYYMDGTTETAIVAATPTGTPPVNPPPTTTALPFQYGAFTAHDAAQAVALAAYGGHALKIIRVYPSRETMGQLQGTWWTQAIPSGFNGNLMVGLPLFPGDRSISNPGSQAEWQTVANGIKAVDPNAYIGLGWEMNIGWPWQLSSGNMSAWVAAFRNIVGWMHTVAPGLRFCFIPNHGDVTLARQAFQSVKDLCFGYGIDDYDAWPADTDANTWLTQKVNATGEFGESYTYAQANNKVFVVGEVGVASGTQWSGHEGGDNPRFINDFFGWAVSKAQAAPGSIVVAYFNEPDPYLKSDLGTNSSNPNASAAYKTFMAQFTN